MLSWLVFQQTLVPGERSEDVAKFFLAFQLIGLPAGSNCNNVGKGEGIDFSFRKAKVIAAEGANAYAAEEGFVSAWMASSSPSLKESVIALSASTRRRVRLSSACTASSVTLGDFD